METIADKTKRIIAETLGAEKEKLTYDTDLYRDIGADSLDVVELVMILEKAFDVSIPDEKIEQMNKVGQYIDYLEKARPLVLDSYNPLLAA